MRKVLIVLVLVTLILTFPMAPSEDMTYPDQKKANASDRQSNRILNMASAGGAGNSIPARQYMSRIITNEQIDIINSYADTSTHLGQIDLTGYLNPGWHVYEVTIDVKKMIAAPEREVVGQIDETVNFRIDEVLGTFYSQLAQGFYNQPFDGILNNYSIYYSTERYNPSLRGNASFMISSDYQTSAAITSLVNMTASEFVLSWASLSGESAALDANSIYWAVINGSTLYKGGVPVPQYPIIYWMAEDSAGTFNSYWRGASSWDLRPYEGILNYTYTPWNRTAGAALEFVTPESLSLLADSTPQTSLSWTFTNGVSNITSIEISTNQSIYLEYDITIWYQDSPTVATNWNIDISGNPVIWNTTTSLSYPVFAEPTARYLDITVQSDWFVQGLYNNTNPGIDYGHNSRAGDVVTCTEMADETWILSCSAPNYVRDIALLDSSDSSPIAYYVDILVDMDIDANISDNGGNPITGGWANLTILQSGSGIYKPSNISASNGWANFTWDIDSTTSGNGTHYVEIFWTNGFEAGYLVTEVFVYYPTTLVSDDSFVNAYADNATAFNIGINFDRIFPVDGMDSSFANVTYSFGVTNGNLTDQGGGRWTQTISTIGMTNGTYSLFVYAEGHALENQSLMITVNLIFETKPLNWSWSNTNNITYTDHTNLSISYLRIDGITRISGATVNVTIEGVPYDMAWDDLTETYWIELTGADFPGAGNFTVYVFAWKDGFEAQNSAINITIESETGLFFDVEYFPATLNISYIERLFIQVTYNFNSVPIDSNTWVRIMFNGSATVDLDYNTTSLKWEKTLNGSLYFGYAWDIIVRASADGYATANDYAMFTVYEDTPIIDSDVPGYHMTINYDDTAYFSIFVTNSVGAPINDANVSFTAFGLFNSRTTGIGGEYQFSITPWTTTGPHEFTVYITQTGYQAAALNLTITVEATTLLEFRNLVSSEYERWNLTVEVRYEDTVHHTHIPNATVTVTLDGTDYILQENDVIGIYSIEIVLDIDPGDYTIYVSAIAEFAVSANNEAGFTVIPKEYVYLEITFDGDLIAGQFMEIRATLRSNNTGNPPVIGETIRFEVWIYFDNGTVVTYADATMVDSTNTDGVAAIGVDVPFGNINKLTAHAIYAGSRTRWSVQTTAETGVMVNPLSLLIAFFLSDIGLMIILSIALLGIVAAGYNRGVKPKKRAAKRSLENQLEMFKDLETVQHFMAIYLDRGTCVFYHPFTDERIQPDLISGFIAAITSVYGEIKGDGVRGTLEEIQYHGLRLNSYSGQYIIGILILEGEMTPLLRERLQFFVELFENQYDQDLHGWTGLVDCFDPEWVVSTLNSAFNYAWHLPHRFGPTQKVSKTNARILDYISAVRDERNEFYLNDLISPLAEMLEKSEAEILDILLSLQDKGIIVPIGIQTILQRQGLALVNGSEESMIIPPSAVDEQLTTEDEAAAGAVHEPEEELEFDELSEEAVIKAPEEVVEEPEPVEDPMEAFVQDVESLLLAKAKEEQKEDGELDKFVKELKEKIGDDEDTEESSKD